MNESKRSKSLTAAISWNELPVYGAQLIRAGVEATSCNVTVIATRPTIPLLGMEEILNRKIHWIARSGVDSWSRLDVPIPDLFFQAGWYIDSFIRLGNEVRANGGKVILLSDNCWRNTPRQWAGAIVYRLFYRQRYAGVWVPGESGSKLMRFLGVPPDKIYDGLYGSDPDFFQVGPPLPERKQRFIVAGRLTRKKGTPWLASAFARFQRESPDWELLVYGDGECKSELFGVPGITLCDFAQPFEIAQAMRSSRFLVLPTLVDHWPLVVSEAALSGCGMILSNEVGNISEFLNDKNGLTFAARSTVDLYRALREAASFPEVKLSKIANESRRLGVKYTPSRWAAQFRKVLAETIRE